MLPIEFLILYPMRLPVAFLLHNLWSNLTRKRVVDMPEATPYKFEYDKPIKNFNQVTKHWKQETKRMYRGNQL